MEAVHFAMEEWLTVPHTHEFGGERHVVLDHPPHRDHGHAGRVVRVNRSGPIGLIEFEGSRDPVVFWPIVMSVLKVAVWHGSDAAILSLSELESFDVGELDNANVVLMREQLNQRRDQYRGVQ